MNPAEALQIQVYDGLLKCLSHLYGSEKFAAYRKERATELGKVPVEQSISAYKKGLFGFAQEYRKPYVTNLIDEAIRNPHPDIYAYINKKQVASKRWLIESLHATYGRELGTVFVLGGWYGALAALIFESGLFEAQKVINFDIDRNAVEISHRVNRHWREEGRFDAVFGNMYELNYEEEAGHQPDLIINTCCEHIPDLRAWLKQVPSGKKLVLQSNDYFEEPTHVNCVHNIEEFEAQAKLSRIDFRGSLKTPDYTRFMLMGQK